MRYSLNCRWDLMRLGLIESKVLMVAIFWGKLSTEKLSEVTSRSMEARSRNLSNLLLSFLLMTREGGAMN